MSIRSVERATQLTFVSLASCKQVFPRIEKLFKDVFRDASRAVLQDIEKRESRKTEVLMNHDEPVGCIVYKRDLSDEFQDLKIFRCFSVTLWGLFDPEKDARKGYRTKLLEQVEHLATEEGAKSIAFCLPNNGNEYVKYLTGKGYEMKVNHGDAIVYKDIQKRRKVDREEDVPAPPPPPPPHKSTAPGKTPIILGEGSYQLTLKKPFIKPIRDGVKTIEGRINSGAPAKMKAGDTLRFFYPQDEQDDVTCDIEKVEVYPGFMEMLQATGFKKCIPDARTLEDAFRVYQNIPGFIDRARQSGVIAIYLKNPRRKG